MTLASSYTCVHSKLALTLSHDSSALVCICLTSKANSKQVQVMAAQGNISTGCDWRVSTVVPALPVPNHFTSAAKVSKAAKRGGHNVLPN